VANAGALPTAKASVVAVADSVGAHPTTQAVPEPVASAIRDEQATVSVDTIPSKSTVVIGGKPMGTTPVELKLPKSHESMVVEIRHSGYQTLREEITPDVDQRLRLTLVPSAVPRAGASASPNAKDSNPYHRFD
jgi:hypothetical protein